MKAAMLAGNSPLSTNRNLMRQRIQTVFTFALVVVGVASQLGCGAADKPADRAPATQTEPILARQIRPERADEPIEAFVFVMDGGDLGTTAQVLAIGTAEEMSSMVVPGLRRYDENWPNWRDVRIVSREEMAELQQTLRAAGFFDWPPSNATRGYDGYVSTLTVYWKEREYSYTCYAHENLLPLSIKLRAEASRMGSLVDSQTLTAPAAE